MDLVEAQKFEKGDKSARRCVRVVIRRVLGEQIVDVGFLGSGKKEDAMWHVPHCTNKTHNPALTAWFYWVRKKRRVC